MRPSSSGIDELRTTVPAMAGSLCKQGVNEHAWLLLFLSLLLKLSTPPPQQQHQQQPQFPPLPSPANKQRVECFWHIHVDPQRNRNNGREQNHKPKKGLNPQTPSAFQSRHHAAEDHAHDEQQLSTGIYLLLACACISIREPDCCLWIWSMLPVLTDGKDVFIAARVSAPDCKTLDHIATSRKRNKCKYTRVNDAANGSAAAEHSVAP